MNVVVASLWTAATRQEGGIWVNESPTGLKWDNECWDHIWEEGERSGRPEMMATRQQTSRQCRVEVWMCRRVGSWCALGAASPGLQSTAGEKQTSLLHRFPPL